MTVGEDLHGSIAVSTQNSCAFFFEPFEKLSVRVSVRIFFAGGNHSDSRVDRVQELRHGRVFERCQANSRARWRPKKRRRSRRPEFS